MILSVGFGELGNSSIASENSNPGVTYKLEVLVLSAGLS